MPEINYRYMWLRLRAEMLRLSQKGVNCFHPVIVLGYMDFLEQIEEEKEEGKKKAAT